MRTAFRVMLALVLLMMLLASLAGVAVWHELAASPGLHITINDEELSAAGFGIGDFLGLVLGLGIAGVVVLLVVPVVLLFSIGLPLLIVGGVLALVCLLFSGIGALLFSPLFLFGLLLWLILRKPRKIAGA
ncbi:hypothetical protein [Paucibacter soli]|uniref:hypothetical protein n=1 Tax=Paucibacter soli TaxID=3133433 RepID=UPI0030B6F942